MSGDPPEGLSHHCYPSPFGSHEWEWRPVPLSRPFSAPARLSDSDVDRIARRVVELQRQAEADPDAQVLVDKVVADNTPKPTRKRRITRRK